jgi:hypothetical protein
VAATAVGVGGMVCARAVPVAEVEVVSPASIERVITMNYLKSYERSATKIVKEGIDNN